MRWTIVLEISREKQTFEISTTQVCHSRPLFIYISLTQLPSKKSSIVCLSFIMQIFYTRSGRMKIDGNLQTKQQVSLKPLTNLNLYLISIIEVWIFLYCTCTISLEFNLITHFLESHNLYRWLTTISQIEVPLYGYLLWILRVIWTNSLKCFFYSCCLF